MVDLTVEAGVAPTLGETIPSMGTGGTYDRSILTSQLEAPRVSVADKGEGTYIPSPKNKTAHPSKLKEIVIGFFCIFYF